MMTPHITKTITDKELFKLAKFFGENALLWRRKFIGLLPEINRRRLWEKHNFSSIFEFSKKLCGLSEKQIRLALNLERRFEDKPNLKHLLTSGAVSINKLARIVSIASIENEEALAEAVKVLPKNAVETLVKDEKHEIQNEMQNGLIKPLIDAKSLPGQTLELSEEVTGKLLELQGKGLNVNKILMEFLVEREGKIQDEKDAIAKGLSIPPATKITKSSRYIPAEIRKIIQKEHGTKCSIPNCKNHAEQLHHTQIFALSKRHDPRFLAPLCKNHHQIAHVINSKVAERISRTSRPTPIQHQILSPFPAQNDSFAEGSKT